MKMRTKVSFDLLRQQNPSPKCELDYSTPYELLVAVILSAQCTDKRVNLVTKKLFEVANTPQAMIELGEDRLSQYIFSCGFYKTKAAHIIEASCCIMQQYAGCVPNDVEQLQKLSGVGRKTANVVYSVAFGGQAIAVDTHVHRVSNRLGLAKSRNVLDTERQLMAEIDKSMWSEAHHLLILHGRYVCKSQNPQCGQCVVSSLCKYYEDSKKSKRKANGGKNNV